MELLVWVIFTIVVTSVLGTFAYGGISAAPWVPLWKKDTKRMLELAQIKPGQKVVDLGAGDGRIIISAARDYGADATGYEFAILPYLWGLVRINLSGLRGQARLKYRNFFNQDLSYADVVCVFLTPAAMKKLKPKFDAELKPGTKILSYAFHLPGWQPVKTDKPNKNTMTIYLYQK